MTKRVSIIGAGLGGLATAIRLAKSGFDITIYEKNKNPGGKMNEYRQGQYRFDSGPSLLTMPFVVDDLFRIAGYGREDFIRFSAIDPVCRYFYRDGSQLDTHANPDCMVQAIADFAPGEEKNYQRYITYCEELYDLAGGVFLFSPIHELRKIMSVKNLLLLVKLHKLDAWRTVDRSLRTFFKDKRLIQLFGRYATYNGSDPYQASATLNIIPYVEYNLGAY
jgi:phytoene desaturase